MAIGILPYFPGPLTDNADDYGLERRIFIQMFLQTRQLAAAVGSPRSPEENQQDMLFARVRFKVYMLLMNGTQRKRRRGVPDFERFISPRHNLPTRNPQRPHWLGNTLA